MGQMWSLSREFSPSSPAALIPFIHLWPCVSTGPCPGMPAGLWLPGTGTTALCSSGSFFLLEDESNRLLLSFYLESDVPQLPGKAGEVLDDVSGQVGRK